MQASGLFLQDKLIGLVTAGSGLIGLVLGLAPLVISHGLVFVFDWIGLSLSAAGIVAGTGFFDRQRWAAWLTILFYTVQLVHITAPDLRLYFLSGLELTTNIGWSRFGIVVYINWVAIVLSTWAVARAFAADGILAPKPGHNPR